MATNSKRSIQSNAGINRHSIRLSNKKWATPAYIRNERNRTLRDATDTQKRSIKINDTLRKIARTLKGDKGKNRVPN